MHDVRLSVAWPVAGTQQIEGYSTHTRRPCHCTFGSINVSVRGSCAVHTQLLFTQLQNTLLKIPLFPPPDTVFSTLPCHNFCSVEYFPVIVSDD